MIIIINFVLIEMAISHSTHNECIYLVGATVNLKLLGLGVGAKFWTKE